MRLYAEDHSERRPASRASPKFCSILCGSRLEDETRADLPNLTSPRDHHRTVGYRGPAGTRMDWTFGDADSQGLIHSPDVAFAIPTRICSE